MRVERDNALALARGLLEEHGASVRNAHVQADALIEAELREIPSHGLQRLPRLLTRIDRGLADPRAEGSAKWRSPAVLEVDGMRGLGPVVAHTALGQLKSRIATSGIAMAAIRNNNHLGIIARYVEEIANWGCVGIAVSSSEALVHPYGGTRALLGTNPIAIAIPTAGRPMVVDLATSAVSMGKIHHYAANGMALAPGWARDAEGRPTIDAAAAKQGAIAPFGGAKGYGLGLALELLVAALAGSELAPDIRGTLDADFVCNKGDVFIAIEMRSSPKLGERISSYLDLLRLSPSIDPGTPVAVPGDRATARREEALENGFEIDPGLWAELNSLSRDAFFEGQRA